MSAITNCPACQTQFIVTEEQLNQHHGKVRCGQCLHVFNAKDALLEPTISIVPHAETISDTATAEAIETTMVKINEPTEASLFNNSAVDIFDTGLTQDDYFITTDKASKPNYTVASWLMGSFALALLLMAIAQSIYFFRTELTIHYPKTKAYLVQACEKIGCRIDLPKQIDFIAIDDSDIQEDTNYEGLIHVSSTLINQANFAQAYPNIELTLTDIDNAPKLRRIFKPDEYLPNAADIVKGMAAGEEVRLKLAITAQDVTLTGYRLFVSY